MEALRMLSKTPGSTDYEAEVERLLSCPICLEVYSKPVVILPCQHNLCRKCANDVFQNRGTPMGSGGRFRCPTCRYEVMLDRHGVYGLQRNILVENIIDMYQSESKKPFRKTEVLMCEDHEEEKVNIFCISCQKPTCSLCKVFGQHKDCTVSPMEKVYKDHKSELSSAISMLVAGNDRLQTVISNTEEMVTMAEENSKRAQNDVSTSFDKLYAVLEQRKQAMLSQIKATAQEKSEVLQAMLAEYGAQLQSSSKLVEEALSLLEEPSPPPFLLVSRDLINRVTSTARDAEVPKPSHNIYSTEAYEVDFSDHIEYLKKIRFNNAEAMADLDVNSLARLDSHGLATGKSSGSDLFQAKLLLPNTNMTEEVIAAAKITKTEDDDDLGDSSSVSSKCEGISDRRDSFNGLDQLDADVKAIAERYLSGRMSTRRSYACSQGESSISNDGRRKSHSDEKKGIPEMDAEKDESRDVDGVKPLFRGRRYSTHDDVGSSISSPVSKGSPRSNSPSSTISNETSTERLQRLLRLHATTTMPDNVQDTVPSSPRERSPSNRRLPPRRRQRLYATHRRRTWSHLLDKKP